MLRGGREWVRLGRRCGGAAGGRTVNLAPSSPARGCSPPPPVTPFPPSLLAAMASKISVGSVRQSIATILEQSAGEQKRNFVETVRPPSSPRPRPPALLPSHAQGGAQYAPMS